MAPVIIQVCEGNSQFRRSVPCNKEEALTPVSVGILFENKKGKGLVFIWIQMNLKPQWFSPQRVFICAASLQVINLNSNCWLEMYLTQVWAPVTGVAWPRKWGVRA